MKSEQDDSTAVCTHGPSTARTELRIAGIPLSRMGRAVVLERMDAGIRKPSHGYISITNTEAMYHATRSSEHNRYVRGAAMSLCDGVGVIVAGLAWGGRVPRFNGPVLLIEACRYGVERGWRHFFCGGGPGTAERLADTLQDRCPGLQVAGVYCPPFRKMSHSEEQVMIEQINAARPDIVWVALGLPKQERWIARYRDRLTAAWLIGVGAAFDYHTGRAHYAPAWIRRVGMEWLYRLMHEPRMFVRNVRSFVFLFEALWSGLTRRPAASWTACRNDGTRHPSPNREEFHA